MSSTASVWQVVRGKAVEWRSERVSHREDAINLRQEERRAARVRLAKNLAASVVEHNRIVEFRHHCPLGLSLALRWPKSRSISKSDDSPSSFGASVVKHFGHIIAPKLSPRVPRQPASCNRRDHERLDHRPSRLTRASARCETLGQTLHTPVFLACRELFGILAHKLSFP